MAVDQRPSTAYSPLEEFLRDYSEAVGGAWEEVEPQVCDLLLPRAELGSQATRADEGLLRIAFDPEALPEHPGAQLAAFGTPLVDRLLSAAVERGRFAEAYVNGLNLAPYDVMRHVRRALTLPDGADLEIQRVRPLHVAQAIFWFEAAFVSDQKEHEILPIGLDLHSGREVRHLDQLLDFSRLAEQPAEYFAEARRTSVAAAYSTARARVLRTLSSLANTRRRELQERVERQVQRMERYYRDQHAELVEGIQRATKRGDEVEKFQARIEALDRERRLRTSELRRKSELVLRLRLISLLVVHQPKLLLKSQLNYGSGASLAALELTWDPLIECLEAIACPQCGSPTYALELSARSALRCPACRSNRPR
jgi:hypothetical protein